MEEPTSRGAPQFATAEYGGGEAGKPCKACGKALGKSFFQVNGASVCGPCTQAIQARFPDDSHSAYLRGLMFGAAGAVLGLILYVGVEIGTGLVIGFVSLAVGFMVGKAMILGSRGVRGRRYQIAAVILTYAAVSLSAIPIYLSQQVKYASHSQADGETSGPARTTPPQRPAKSVVMLIMLGLASPFLDLADPVHGLIGLVILFVGIRIAWRLTGGTRVTIVGPLNGVPAAT